MHEDQNKQEVVKKAKKSNFSTIKISSALHKKMLMHTRRANKKDYGRRIKIEDILQVAISKLTTSDIENLQKNSYSNQDLLEIRFREFQKKNSGVSKDEFIGLLLSGKAENSGEQNAAV